MASVICSPGSIRAKIWKKVRPRWLRCYSRAESCRWSWSSLKNSLSCSDARVRRQLIASDYFSLASAANVRCWAFPGPCSTTGPHRCRNRLCGSWPGSLLSTRSIHAAVAAGWWTTWPEKRSRSGMIGYETSCSAWVDGRSTRNPVPRSQENCQSAIPAWWTSG